MKIIVLIILAYFGSNAVADYFESGAQKELLGELENAVIIDKAKPHEQPSIFQRAVRWVKKWIAKVKTYFVDARPAYCDAILSESLTLDDFRRTWDPARHVTSCPNDELLCKKKNDDAFAAAIRCY